jgi:sugar/nucleoside kinase (ribokinase family)
LLSIDQMPLKMGGCAANVALVLAKHGIPADICGCVGNDDAANVVLQRLQSAGIGSRQIQRVDSHPTSKTVVLLVEGEDRRFIHSFGANAAFRVGQIDRDWIAGLKVFYLGGLFAMPGLRADELTGLLEYCRRQGVVTVVDVIVPHDFDGLEQLSPLLPHIDYFLPNNDEAQRLTGLAEPEAQTEAFLGRGAHTVLITCGPHGSITAAGRSRWKAESYRIESVDPTGAGDAFDAGIIMGILRGWEMEQTLRFAAAMGASATTAVGTTDGVWGPEEARAFLERCPLNVTRYTQEE